jgi:hypothetical protein
MTTPDPTRSSGGDDSPTSPIEPEPAAPPPAEPVPAAPPPAAAASPSQPPAGPPPAAPGAPGPAPATPPSTATWAATPATTTASPTPAGFVVGIILVVVGGIVLVSRVADLTLGADAWPLWIIVPGVAMLIGSFAIPPRGGLGLAIPGAIIAMVGVVLWVQDVYDVYATWAYAWALVAPTAPGLAMVLYGLVKGDRDLVGDGVRTTLVGLGLFLGFALFFEGVIGLSGHRIANLDEVLPYAAIGLGSCSWWRRCSRRPPADRLTDDPIRAPSLPPDPDGDPPGAAAQRADPPATRSRAPGSGSRRPA